MKKIRVYMGIPSMGTRSDVQSYALRDIEKRYADTVELVYPDACVHRMFHDFARNAIVEDFLKTDCDVLWFLDSDVAPPANILDLFQEYGTWELAGAPYPVFMTPGGSWDKPMVTFCVYKRDEKGLKPTAVPTQGKAFVDGMATGCMFIKREIFSSLQKPYFEFKFEPETRHMVEGEDLGFCRKVGDSGYAFYTDFSLVCSHYKMVNLLDVQVYAAKYAQTFVDAYHDSIKPTIAKLTSQVEKLKQEKKAPVSSLILPEHYQT